MNRLLAGPASRAEAPRAHLLALGSAHHHVRFGHADRLRGLARQSAGQRLERSLLVWAAAALVLTGCERTRACPDGWCGTAVSAGAEPDVLLPPVSQIDVGAWLGDLLFSKLADLGSTPTTVGDQGFEPQLAERWSWEDSTTLRFRLDPRAHWHDGTPVTARDVAFSFDVYRDPAVNSGARPLLGRIASVTAADSHTVVVRFSQPYPEAFYDAVYHVRVLPAHWLDTVPRARLAQHPFGRHPIGSGPFRFVRWEAGQQVELAGDSTYFLGRPGLRRVIWRVVPSVATLVTQLAAGETDIGFVLGSPELVQQLRGVASLRLVPYALNAYGYIGFNFRDPANPARPHPLFANAEVRRALSMAVDRRAVVRAVLGEVGDVPEGPLSRGSWIWSDSLHALPFDTAGARRLLDGLGWQPGPDGVRRRAGRRLEFELLVPVTSGLRRSSAVIVQEQLKRIGAAVRISELDISTVMARARAGRFDAAYLSWVQDPSPRALEQEWTTQGIGASNYQHYSNPAFDRLVQQASLEFDRDRASALWRQAVAVINQDAPAIWMYVPGALVAVHQRFQDVAVRPDLWMAWLWKWRVNPDALLPRDLAVVP
jgi:peptide/nickel transport system substrate-binding protein